MRPAQIASVLLAALFTVACTQLGLNYASLKTVKKPIATPEIQATSLAEWDTEAQELRELFAKHVYGTWPDALEVSFGETRIVDPDYLGGRGQLEETPIQLGTGEGARIFVLSVAYPHRPPEALPAPIIIGQTFSDNCMVFQSISATGRDGAPCTEDQIKFSGFMGWAVKNIFGRFIAKAPIEQYFDRGYAYANFYASQIVPDSPRAAAITMEGLRTEPDVTASSALSYWGYGYSAAIDLLETDPRIDASRIAAWGHSRHGKSALIAGAWDARIGLIIAHQSGFGGAALSRSRAGERIDRVTRTYPHWFTPAFQASSEDPDTLPVDQHMLIALNAPRPVFLGNGRRDVWSDPNSTYRAAIGADRVYELYGRDGLNQAGLKAFNPAAQISFFMRSGGHGITPEDVEAFLGFLDAHWGSAQTIENLQPH